MAAENFSQVKQNKFVSLSNFRSSQQHYANTEGAANKHQYSLWRDTERGSHHLIMVKYCPSLRPVSCI